MFQHTNSRQRFDTQELEGKELYERRKQKDIDLAVTLLTAGCNPLPLRTHTIGVSQGLIP